MKYQKINDEEITKPSLSKCIGKGSRRPIRRRPARCQCNYSNLIVLFFLCIFKVYIMLMACIIYLQLLVFPIRSKKLQIKNRFKAIGWFNVFSVFFASQKLRKSLSKVKQTIHLISYFFSRNFLRRQSSRCSRSKQIGEPNEDYFEINPNLDHQDDRSSVQEVGPAFLNSPSGIEENIEKHASKSKGREFPERSSIVRTPLRGLSYKEVSLLRPLRRAVRVTPTRKLPLCEMQQKQE